MTHEKGEYLEVIFEENFIHMGGNYECFKEKNKSSMADMKDEETKNEVSAEIIFLRLQYGMPKIPNPKKDSVLYKPFNRLIEGGAPIGYIKPLILNTSFFQFIDGNKADYTNSLEYLVQVPHENLKILGCLCYSEGQKLLFYPSFNSTYLTHYTDREDPIRHYPKIDVNHFSLENNLKKWHVTHMDGHIHNFKTQKINKNLIFWFGLSVQNSTELEQAYRINPFGYLCPLSDVERRRSILMNTIKHLEEIVITPSTLEKVESNNYFWHFDFYYKMGSDPIQGDMGYTWVFNPLNFDEVPDERTIPWVSYDSDIPNHDGRVVIVARKISGKLKDQVLITANNKKE